ncbi:ABC transporter permease [Claveliimonas bilis]|uniref:ABC transporter permease n=1 Tax=Claveliimonas bilis TaxID=3028070 RepID=A0ABN6YX09_9FIRM|nr:ABC transporter permease [Claveliimonas bilis]BDZ77857.1 ABC transporter permease [Claveliimonas bilis]
MNSRIYSRLAVSNIKNNRKTYVPFILTSILTVMMYYIIDALAGNKSIEIVNVITVLRMGCGVMVVFSVIFLFYTNSFLIKRRKKEIAVYNILGMGKGHIGKMLTVETLIVGGISIAGGIAGGMAFGKLMHLLLIRIIHYDVGMEFHISVQSVFDTVILFAFIFFLTWFYNLFQIRLANPIELLRGGSAGEKEPKTKVILALIGVVTMAAGYYLAVSTKNPLEAINTFFVAVILVIIGTYALFLAGSIALLKLLRKRKKFYYKSNHFVSVSGMIYRMKQNAVGLANICILSTIVLVMISSTVSLYVGVDDVMAYRYPNDYQMTLYEASQEKIDKANKLIEEELDRGGLKKEGETACHYGTAVLISQGGNKFTTSENGTYSPRDLTELYVIPQEDYQKLENTSTSLKENEVIIYTTAENYGRDSIQIDGRKFQVTEELDDFVLEEKNQSRVAPGMYMIVANDEVAMQLDSLKSGLRYDIDFDMTGSDEEKAVVEEKIADRITEELPGTYFTSRQAGTESFFGFYGCLFFIGMYLGFMFLVATVLIIYYKQISEGLDDRERYVIMQKVGMDKREIRRAIRSQILIVFFLPLLFSILHIMVAFNVITKLLGIFGLFNTGLFVLCTVVTVLIFAAFYIIVFAITAREYYKIVN